MFNQRYFNYNEGVLAIGKNKNIIKQDVINSIKFIDDIFNHTSELIIIIDVRTNHIQINEDSLAVIFDEIKLRTRKYSKVRIAVVLECPIGVAFSFLLEHQLNNGRYLYKTFSTMSAAKEWIIYH